MIFAKPTPKGGGLTFWGDYNDLVSLHESIDNLSLLYFKDCNVNTGSENLLSIIQYNIRHAYQGKNLVDTHIDNGTSHTVYYGFTIDWITILFTISELRYKAGRKPTNEIVQSHLFQLEYWIEKSLYQYDTQGAQNIAFFLQRGINTTSQYTFLLYQHILKQFFSQKSGKKRFRSIPELLTITFQRRKLDELIDQWNKSAEFNNCEISDLEYDFDYIVD